MGKIRYRIVEKNNIEVIEEIYKIVFHTITMGDVEDPNLFVAQPIYEWQQTPAGKYVMENAIPESPTWERIVDHLSFGYKYFIIAEMEKKKLAEYYLRFDKPTI